MTPSAVLVISFGGPEKKADIMPFLEIVTRGRGIPKERLEEVAHHYDVIGGKSPINDLTRRQAEGLERELKAEGRAMKAYIGNRNWHPFLQDTMEQMVEDGVKSAVGFITAAHRCSASLERYIEAVDAARKAIGPKAPVIYYVSPWFENDLFIDAISKRVEDTLDTMPPERREKLKWFFTAHSIPCDMADKSYYVSELKRTAALVSEKFDKKEWDLAYSSRSGRPQDPWLEPDVCDLIKAEAGKGVKNILFIPIGFIADHVEILFDLDVEAQAAAREAGVTLYRAKSVGDHPLFCRMMAEVVEDRFDNGEEPTANQSSALIGR